MNKPVPAGDLLDSEPSSLAPKCQHCGKHFTPRQSGGREQKFCSADCRRAHHDAEGQRAQRAATCSTLPAVIPPAAKAAPETAASGHDKGTLLGRQGEVTFEFTADGSLLLTQARWPDEDAVIYIAADNLMPFIDRLCDIAGIGSAS